MWEISWDCASFWVLTVEGSGYFVRYCGVLMKYREKGSKFVVSEIILGGELWYFFRCRDTVPLMVFEYVLGRVGGGGDSPCECVPLILLG